MPPGTINKAKNRALKVRREKIRTKKKLVGAAEKHKTQLDLLKSRNPKHERKMAKRRAALERASEKDQETLALIQEEHMMAEDAAPKKQQQGQQPAKAKGKGKKKGKKEAAGDGDEMEE